MQTELTKSYCVVKQYKGKPMLGFFHPDHNPVFASVEDAREWMEREYMEMDGLEFGVYEMSYKLVEMRTEGKDNE